VAFFDVIETVDREKLARALADEIARAGRAPRLYVQVNVGEEPQKAGVAPGEADAFIALCRGELGLTIEGLMCIPPADEDPAPHFSPAAGHRGAQRRGEAVDGHERRLRDRHREGATSVRVGSAIFGSRSYPA
jgi:uncharacterized pyridoxal phosphate-containing UPF0001 family protein